MCYTPKVQGPISRNISHSRGVRNAQFVWHSSFCPVAGQYTHSTRSGSGRSWCSAGISCYVFRSGSTQPRPHNSGLISVHETFRNLHFVRLLSTVSLSVSHFLLTQSLFSHSVSLQPPFVLAIKILRHSRTFHASNCDIDILVDLLWI
jgi:hypothetical protein